MSQSGSINLICPSCGADKVRLIYEALAVPVNSVLLLRTREEALRLPTGDIRLRFCPDCGFIYNSSFNRQLVEYSIRCEESQGFSPFFRAWHEDLARRLVDRYSLRGKKIIEIGSGKGEFLALLCEFGANRGVGFDPAYVAERIGAESAGRIHFISDFFNENSQEVRGDFLCCKMTLEHIPDCADFIEMVSRSLRDAPETCVFFQVPDVVRILDEEAFWDIYYEHCSYFSAGSLARLFRHAGFDILNVGQEYNGQYVTVEARPTSGTAPPSRLENDLDELAKLVECFRVEVPRRVTEWRERLEGYRELGLKTVVWGAGSKGVTFLSSLNVPGAVGYVVDINPHMWNHYLAKTGIQITQPSALREYRPDVVIVMNPIYREEITAELLNLGLKPEVIST
jgi:SAM-dependent methyltransferase